MTLAPATEPLSTTQWNEIFEIAQVPDGLHVMHHYEVRQAEYCIGQLKDAALEGGVEGFRAKEASLLQEYRLNSQEKQLVVDALDEVRKYAQERFGVIIERHAQELYRVEEEVEKGGFGR